MKIAITKLSPLATLPQQMKESDAAFDLYSTEDYSLQPGERKMFPTNIAMAIPQGRYGRIAGRSGLAYKHGIAILGGVVDAGYRGDIGVVMLNTSDQPLEIQKGHRIAQMIIERCAQFERDVVDELPESQRSSDGRGSTGY